MVECYIFFYYNAISTSNLSSVRSLIQILMIGAAVKQQPEEGEYFNRFCAAAAVVVAFDAVS